MSFALPHALEGGGLVGWFAVELAELPEQRQGDLLEGACSFLDGREPSIEVLWPVQNHLVTYLKRLQRSSCFSGGSWILRWPGAAAGGGSQRNRRARSTTSSTGCAPAPPLGATRGRCSSSSTSQSWLSSAATIGGQT